MLLFVLVLADHPLIVALSTGAAIFQHQWRPGEPASPGGDGLGPVHNDVSCIACHHQGGVGGGGGIEKNVTLLSLVPRKPGMSVRMFHKNAAKLHPGLVTDLGELKTTLVLHKFSTDANYAMSRQRFVGIEMPLTVTDECRPIAERMVADHPVRSLTHPTGIAFQVSQRNSPALFGAGLIDAVPDQLLHKLEELQEKRGVVSGRASPVNGQVGKFGWKAQTARLQDFVRDACANELGLQVPGKDQGIHPMHLDYKPKGFDLNTAQLKSLTTFVAMLPRSHSLAPGDDQVAANAQRGRQAFMKVGCAECHVETLGSSSSGIHGIYSDLLLHDMGPKLADPMLANPKTVKVKIRVSASAAGGNPSAASSSSFISPSAPSSGGDSYGGGGGGGSPGFLASSPGPGGTRTIETNRIVPTNRSQEWRTPPLWGVNDSSPYLHDGRASTLTEAILFHGGEAKFSVKRFLALAPSDRIALIEFLNTLVSPQVTEI